MSVALALMQMEKQSAGGLLAALLSTVKPQADGSQLADFTSLLENAKNMSHQQAVNTQARKLENIVTDFLLNGNVGKAIDVLQQIPPAQRLETIAKVKEILANTKAVTLDGNLDKLIADVEKIVIQQAGKIQSAKNSQSEILSYDINSDTGEHDELAVQDVDIVDDYLMPVQSLYMPDQAASAVPEPVAAAVDVAEQALIVTEIPSVDQPLPQMSYGLLQLQEVFAGSDEVVQSPDGKIQNMASAVADVNQETNDNFGDQIKNLTSILTEWKAGWQQHKAGENAVERTANPVAEAVKEIQKPSGDAPAGGAEDDSTAAIVAGLQIKGIVAADAVNVPTDAGAGKPLIKPDVSHMHYANANHDQSIKNKIDIADAVPATLGGDNLPSVANGSASKDFADSLNDHVADSHSKFVSPSVVTDRSNVSDIAAQLRPGSQPQQTDGKPVFSLQPNTPMPQSPAEQVNVHIKMAIDNGADKIRVHLNPAELGHVDVKMEIAHDGTVKLHMIAERQDTLDMLRSDSRDLARALQQNGLRMENSNMQFSLRDDGQSQQAFNQQNSNRGNQNNAWFANQHENAADNDDFVPSMIAQSSQRLGLDIRI